MRFYSKLSVQAPSIHILGCHLKQNSNFTNPIDIFSPYNSVQKFVYRYRSVQLVLLALLREFAYSADLPWLPKFKKLKKKI